MDEKDGIRTRPGEADGQGLSPVRAFIVVCTLATVVGGGFFATRDAAPSEPPPTTAPRSPDYSLTDEEALAEFERLNAQLMKAYEERNIALAEDIFTSDSPMLPRVRREIQALIRTSVLSLTRFDPRTTEVVATSPTELTLKRVEDVYPRFQTEAGVPASDRRSPFREWSRWTLIVEGGRWLLHDSLVTDRRLLKRPADDQ